MRKMREMLLSKNGFSTMKLAQAFLKINVGERIPTVSDFVKEIGLARGTIQNALKMLTDTMAVELEARGSAGTYLKRKDANKLLDFAGIDSVVGVMPLPYSKRYEGLATGLISGLENTHNIPVSIAYMRGSENRIAMLLTGRYDFAIVSRYAAERLMERKGLNLTIVTDFGPHSYLGHHVILFHDPNQTHIQDGMRVGIDSESVDQKNLTEAVCKGKQVELVDMNYSNLTDEIRKGTIDAAVWNEDEILDKDMQIPYTRIEDLDDKDTRAVLVADPGNEVLISLLKTMMPVDTVMETQKMVMEGKIMPCY